MPVEDYGKAASIVRLRTNITDPAATRCMLAKLYLPGVHVDARGHIVCDHPNVSVAKLLVHAAVIQVRASLKAMPHG